VLHPEFVRRKLQLITDDLGQLAQFRGISHQDLVADPIRLAAVERMVERIVLRAIDVNEHIISASATGAEERTTRLTYRETFLRLADYDVYAGEFATRIAASAGLRNILVHEYNDIDHTILHASIRTALEEYAEYVTAVGGWLDD
jgi:uncharacterized protein YutE (UPF0331/DUF86 family)